MSALAAGIAATAAVIGAGLQYKGQRDTNEAQARENRLAFERERQQIAEMNEYNSASAQAARLRAAGLNPNLMYGDSPGAAAGEQNDIARYQPAEFQSPMAGVSNTITDSVNALISIREQENKNKIAQSQVELNATLKDLNVANMHLSNAEAKTKLELLGYQIDALAAQAENLHTGAQLNREKILEVGDNRHLLLQKFNESKASEKELLERAFNLSAQTARIVALLPSEREWMQAGTQERMAMVAKASYECRVLEAEEFLKYTQRKGVKADIQLAERKLSYLKHQTIQGYINSAGDLIYKSAMAVGQFYNPTASMTSTYGTIQQNPTLYNAGGSPIWNMGPDGVLQKW